MGSSESSRKEGKEGKECVRSLNIRLSPHYHRIRRRKKETWRKKLDQTEKGLRCYRIWCLSPTLALGYACPPSYAPESSNRVTPSTIRQHRKTQHWKVGGKKNNATIATKENDKQKKETRTEKTTRGNLYSS